VTEADGAAEPDVLTIGSGVLERIGQTRQQSRIHERAIPVDDADDAAHRATGASAAAESAV